MLYFNDIKLENGGKHFANIFPSKFLNIFNIVGRTRSNVAFGISMYIS